MKTDWEKIAIWVTILALCILLWCGVALAVKLTLHCLFGGC